MAEIDAPTVDPFDQLMQAAENVGRVDQPTTPVAEEQPVEVREYNFNQVQLTEMQDIDTTKRVSEFETVDQAKFAMWAAENQISVENAEAAVPEIANTVQTMGESFYFGSQMNVSRVGAALFGDAMVSPVTGAIVENLPYAFEGPITGPALGEDLRAGTESFGRFMRGVFWTWHDRAEEALMTSRRNRDFDPNKFSSVFGEATVSVLGSMGAVATLGVAGIPAAAAGSITTAAFGVLSGLEEMDESLAAGSTEREALAWGLMKGLVTNRAEQIGLGWLFRTHSSTIARIADATVGEGFEEIVERVGNYAKDELAAGFERYVVQNNGMRTNTVYGPRLLRTWSDWEDSFKEGLYVAAVASLAAGTVNFAVGGHVYKQAREDLQKMGVSKEDAESIVEQAMVQAASKAQADISLSEGIDYDQVEYTNRQLDDLLTKKTPNRPGAIAVDLVQPPQQRIPSQDPILIGRGRMLDQELTQATQELEDIQQQDLVPQEDIPRQEAVVDKIQQMRVEQEVLRSGKAVVAEAAEVKSLKEQGYEPLAVSGDKDIMVPARVLLRAQENVAVASVRAYKQGVRKGQQVLSKEGLAARRALRDYIKSAEGIEAKDRERLMRRLTDVKDAKSFERVLPSVEARLKQQLERRRVSMLKSSIDDIVRRYRKRKDVEVGSKKVFDQILAIRKDPSVREQVLRRISEEGSEPTQVAQSIEQMMARYYSKHASTEAELTQIYDVLRTFYSAGATEANKLAAQKADRFGKIKKQLIKEISAEPLTLDEEVSGIRPQRSSVFNPVNIVTALNEAHLNFDSIMRLLTSGRAEENSKFLEQLGLFEAQLTQFAQERQATQAMEDAYRTAYGDKTPYQVAKRVENDSRPLPEPMGLPLYNEAGGLRGIASQSISSLRTVWTYWQNSKSRAALEKLGVTEESITYIEENILTESDYRFIDETQNIMYDLYTKVKPVYERLSQKPLGFEDFYLPLIVSTEGVEQGTDSHLIDILLGTKRDNLRKEFKEPSAVKSRRGGRAAVINRDYTIINKYIRDMSHFYGMAETLAKLDAVFGDSDVRQAVEKKYGDVRMSSIDKALKAMRRNTTWDRDKKIANKFNRFINNISTGMIKASGMKLGEKQLISAFASIPDVSFGEFVDGLATLPGAIKSGEIKVLMEHPYFKERGWDNFSTTMRLINDSIDQTQGPIRRNMPIDQFLTLAMRFGDKGGLLASTWTVYNAYKKQGMDSATALNKAFEASNTAQQSPFMSQIPVGALDGNFLANTFFKFKSATNQFFNNVYVAGAEWTNRRKRITKYNGFAEGVRAATQGPQAKRFAKTILWYHILQPAIYNFISNGFNFDPEDQVAYTILGPFANTMFLGEVLLNSTQIALLFAARMAGHDVDSKDFWKFRSRLTNSTVVVSWYKALADIQNTIADLKDGDFTAEDGFELVEDLGRVGAAFSPTGGAVLQQTGRAVQAFDDMRKEDYNAAALRFQGFTNYVVEQSKKNDKIKRDSLDLSITDILR